MAQRAFDLRGGNKMTKNKVALVGLASIVLSLVGGTNLASAASVPTKSDVIFEEDKDPNTIGEIIRPGTPSEVIEPDEGGHTTGSLRINHVPNIHFGNQKISTASKEYNAVVEGYKKDGVANYIPNFVQVADARGSMTAKWKLSVVGTIFSPTVKTDSPKLTNTHITLNQEKITNNVYDELTPNTTLDRVAGFGTTAVKINTDGTSGIDILNVKANQNTNSTITSSVFNANYTKDVTYTADQENTGISLHVPASDIKVDGETYEANLIWTLADVI